MLEGMIAGSKIGGQRGTLQALTQGAPPHGLGVGTILPEERVGLFDSDMIGALRATPLITSESRGRGL